MAMAIAVGIIMTGCESDDSNGVGFGEDNTKDVAVTKDNVEKVKKIFYSIPSTIEMASMIKRSGAAYNNELLNDINNVSNYTSSKSKAINLGIYGADLSYTSIFNRNQESVFYLSCSKQLAEQLDISNALSDDLLDRIQEQVEDREALTDIVTETYWSLDSYLKDNDREELSTMMVAGGWLEGLYLSTQIYLGGSADDELQQRIVDQGFALDHLIQLVESHEGMGSMVDLKTDLMSIHDLYKQSQAEYQETTGETDGVTVIGGPKYTMTAPQLDDLAGLVKEIRTKYVS
ncbi:MAG: hypothetical protein HKN39_01230 [Flavobacteriales bacterium]|nr:hypothetical protein [Flavobacteriales bacterium]